MTIFEVSNLAKQKAREKNYELNNYEIKKLLAYELNMQVAEIIVNQRYQKISEKEKQSFLKHVDELISGKPLQYITNQQYFMKSLFYVDESVLIPQPDTEILVETAVNIINNSKKNVIKVLDLCTGSGAIAVSIKKEFGNKVDVVATDVSKKALEIAKKNCEIILKDKSLISFKNSNMFESIEGKFDFVLCNPPYIKTDEIDRLPEDVKREPIIALDGGKDGLDYYRIIKENIDKYLKKEGYLILEIGYNQKSDLMKLFTGSKCIKDYAGNDRVIIYERN